MENKIDWTAIAENLDLGNSQQNSEEWHDSKLIWNKSASLSNKKRYGQSVDFGSALSQMKLRMENLEEEEDLIEAPTQSAKRISLFSRNQLKYVASVSILMMLSFVAFYIVTQKTGKEVAKEEIQHNNSEKIKNLMLSDGTNVSLAQNAKLIYPIEFSDSKRVVKLEGKAFFDVKRNETKPFLIETNQVNVEVLGTSFDLEDAGSEVNLVVATGKVAFSDKSSEKSFKVLAGESAKLDVANNTLSKLIGNDKFGNEGSIVWDAERISFNNVSLEKVIEFIADWKNVQIEFQADEEMKSNSRKTSFESSAPLNKILGNILDGTEIKFENLGQKIILK